MTLRRMNFSLVLAGLVAMTACGGPNSFGIAKKSAQELTVVSDADLCHAQRFWRSPQMMSEINRRNLDCNATAASQRSTGATTDGAKGQPHSAAAAQGSPTTTQASATKGDIRSIDFLNYSYHPTLCTQEYGKDGIGKVVRVNNGEFKNADVYYGVDNNIIYGDLTNDNSSEAVVHIGCGYFTANYGLSEIFVYTMKEGQPSLLAQLNDNDMERDYLRSYPGGTLWSGLSEVKVVKGDLVFERPAEGAHCCPEYVVTLRYHWNGTSLVQVGKPERRKFIESQPATTAAAATPLQPTPSKANAASSSRAGIVTVFPRDFVTGGGCYYLLKSGRQNKDPIEDFSMRRIFYWPPDEKPTMNIYGRIVKIDPIKPINHCTPKNVYGPGCQIPTKAQRGTKFSETYKSETVRLRFDSTITSVCNAGSSYEKLANCKFVDHEFDSILTVTDGATTETHELQGSCGHY